MGISLFPVHFPPRSPMRILGMGTFPWAPSIVIFQYYHSPCEEKMHHSFSEVRARFVNRVTISLLGISRL